MYNYKIRWYVVNKEYVNYLKQFDNKVQNINYGSSSKPYIGVVFSINDFNYYVPISSVKPKYYDMVEKIDFFKLMEGEKIISVINLNNMIPVSKNDIKLLNYDNITEFFSFKNEKAKTRYIELLRVEMTIINNRKDDLMKRAKNLYRIKTKFPNSNISLRCCDFKLLEQKCLEYKR